MEKSNLPEVWLRGPSPGIPALLQPVAHALLQVREEIIALMDGFPDPKGWDRPAGVPAPFFHLRHLSGVLDRLFTYARGEALSREQLAYLDRESMPATGIGVGSDVRSGADLGAGPDSAQELVQRFSDQVDKAIGQLRVTREESLKEVRLVGRARIPSTVLGLLFHAAEHSQRHTGQLLVTVKLLHPIGL